MIPGFFQVLTSPRKSHLDELSDVLARQNYIPTKFLYLGDRGIRHWHDSVSDPLYAFSVDSLSASQKNAATLAESSDWNGNRASFISLGCGDGSKDAVYVNAIRSSARGRILDYYPVDVSVSLLQHAVWHVQESCDGKGTCIPVCADFTMMNGASGPLRDLTPKIVTCLGNTVGNNSERDVLYSAIGMLIPGDLFCLEFCSSNLVKADRRFLSQTATRDDYTPLGILSLQDMGVDVDNKDVYYEVVTDVSVIGGGHSVLCMCRELNVQGSVHKDVRLACVHSYDVGAVAAFLSESFGLAVLAKYSYGTSSCVIARYE